MEWSTLSVLNYTDPFLSQIVSAKQALQKKLEANIDSQNDDIEVENNNDNNDEKQWVELLMAACDGDIVTLEAAIRSHASLVNQLHPSNEAGISCLIFAIAFDQYQIVESLLDSHAADVDQHDTLVAHYTPLMWAVYFNQLDTVKLLLDHQADPYLSPKDDNKTAVSLVSPNTAIYEFFHSHGLLGRLNLDESADDFYHHDTFGDNSEVDELLNQIRLQSIAATSALTQEESDDDVDYDEEQSLAADYELVQTPTFVYEKLVDDQYIKFTDSDIPALLDYIFGLRAAGVASLQHDTKVPAAVVFQLLRYSHLKVNSVELTEFLFDCFLARLKAVTNTREGAFNLTLQSDDDKVSLAAGGAGDIVLLSYWLSMIQFLHFYLSKSNFYASYPQFLQSLIDVTQALISTLSFSVNSRLNALLEDCLLNFTNLVDVSNVLYAKDWNLFKNKNKKHPSTYEDIFNMLYPPSQTELMKPSPIRYIQVLAALDYVLRLHQVDALFKLQTFSQVFYYINATTFNRIINNGRYCSRSKAIQLRLNISTLEDWLRSHNYKIYRPEKIGGLQSLVPEFKLKNLLEETNSSRNIHSLSFYYNSLYHVGKNQLMPTIELLQWLQCMSSMNDSDILVNTINQFDSLNYHQLLKTNKMYRYEVDEPKVGKPQVQLLKRLVAEQGDNQIEKLQWHYLPATGLFSKDHYINFDPNYIFNTALPNMTELINNYGLGLGGVRLLRAKKYQPSLPISVMDDIDEILHENVDDTFDYEKERKEDDEEEEKPQQHIRGDELFKEVRMPSSLAHKEWDNDDIEANPW